jgi:uncharacterized protein
MKNLDAAVYERICGACGFCCDGTLFADVRLHEEDNPKDLLTLGFKLKRRKGFAFFKQPCQARVNEGCRVYACRPSRCRAFECRQLLALKAEETTEVEVLQKIKETRELMQDIDNLLTRAGDDRKKKSLLQRYEHVLSEPVDLSDGEAPFEIRGELSGAMEALDERLNEDFRV